MFTMAKVRIGVTYLDEHLVENDYYSEKEKVVGQWYWQGRPEDGDRGQDAHHSPLLATGLLFSHWRRPQ